MQAKNIFAQISEKFRYVKCIENILQRVLLQYERFMNNIIILLLAVRICKVSDNRGSDKQGHTVLELC